MKEFSQLGSSEDDMLVLCILSHGVHGGILGSDSKLVKERTILDCLNNTNCSMMAGKPKLLIIQACQVGRYYYMRLNNNNNNNIKIYIVLSFQ